MVIILNDNEYRVWKIVPNLVYEPNLTQNILLAYDFSLIIPSLTMIMSCSVCKVAIIAIPTPV